LIAIGRLVNVHATHGELRLLPFNPTSPLLSPGTAVVLRRDGELSPTRITAVRPHKRLLLITLEDCTTRNAAEALVGCELCVQESQLPPAKEDEVYHYELVGMTVVCVGGSEVGTIEQVLPLPSNDVCVVRSAAGREHLIPIIASVIRKIDREARRLVIEPLPGLLEI
jgi:16S rRNA processing protein RimM